MGLSRNLRIVLSAVLLGLLPHLAGGADAGYSHFFASQVVNFTPGPGYEYAPNVENAVGGPRGGGMYSGSLHVVSLGQQGRLTLGFGGGAIADGPGSDFIVFENPINLYSPTRVFAELIRVQVSSNGTDFAEFPTSCGVPGPVGPTGGLDPALVSGFAGVHPVLANVDANQIDPFAPAAAGGDAFDLSALAGEPLVQAGLVNLNSIRFVRLVDVLGDGSERDSRSPAHAVYDPTGNMPQEYGGYPTSADVDAVSVINGKAPLAGDCNRDGMVSFADYQVLESHFGGSGGWEQGDCNGDGLVNFADYQVMEANFGNSVPEPGTLAMLLAGAAFMCRGHLARASGDPRARRPRDNNG